MEQCTAAALTISRQDRSECLILSAHSMVVPSSLSILKGVPPDWQAIHRVALIEWLAWQTDTHLRMKRNKMKTMYFGGSKRIHLQKDSPDTWSGIAMKCTKLCRASEPYPMSVESMDKSEKLPSIPARLRGPLTSVNIFAAWRFLKAPFATFNRNWLNLFKRKYLYGSVSINLGFDFLQISAGC